MTDIESRMISKTAVNAVSGCHVWIGAKNSRGYGVIWFEGSLELAHRVAFFLSNQRWPAKELVIDHVCENKQCVNSRHLRELTNSQNIRRAYPRGDQKTEDQRAMWRKSKAKQRAKGGE